MPVPDQVRDDGSGIQYRKPLNNSWIPGQARNDNKTDMRRFVNCDTVWQAGIPQLRSPGSFFITFLKLDFIDASI